MTIGKSSQILFQARANCMPLNYKNRHIEGREKKCDLCENEIEDVGHFLIECKTLYRERDMNIINKHKVEDKKKWIGNILWEEKNVEKLKLMLKGMWDRRIKIRKEKGIKR